MNPNIAQIGRDAAAKVTPDQVRAIRHERKQLDALYRDLATKYEVSITTIHMIVSEKTWKDI